MIFMAGGIRVWKAKENNEAVGCTRTLFLYLQLPGVRGGAVCSGSVLQARMSRVRLEFFIEIILPATLWPWGQLSPKYEYHKYILRGNDAPCLGLTNFPHSCADCHEIWEPQPSETVSACPGLHRECFTSNFRSNNLRNIPNDIFYLLAELKIFIYSTIYGR
jgi:hypothetical protein